MFVGKAGVVLIFSRTLNIIIVGASLTLEFNLLTFGV